MAGEEVGGKKQLAARAGRGQRAQQRDGRESDAGMARGFRAAEIAPACQHQTGEPEQDRGGLAAIALEIVQARHGIVVEVEDARRQQSVEGFDRQPEAPDRVGERGGDGMAGDLGAPGAGQRLAPPGEPHLAGERLAQDIAQPADLVGKGGERVEMRARRGGGEQRGEPAVALVGAGLRLAMGVSGRQRRGNRRLRRHGAATSAAATLRFSPSSTL